MTSLADTGQKKYVYRVVRLMEEIYLVESDTPLKPPEEVWGQLMHPDTSTLKSETIQQVKP